ncbi:ATP-dependent Lon protease [Bodo saltans virus]|uniref:ATP-dependent Lon protease n=1 Tax=Bodo saltans virus TaxID=2024608 RepID=A0A2H4UUN2_9VIRU|nr:ATP-dependent Lon protease [Bodo saltans virus]ATZ80535.1 ATP-dependent Lon protease [Bodo saltans virus]
MINKNNKLIKLLETFMQYFDNENENEIDILMPKKRRIEYPQKYIPKSSHEYNFENNIVNEMAKRNIVMNDVYNLNLCMDDNIWFFNHIRIRDNMEDNLEKLELANMIYHRYITIKNPNYRLLEDFKKSVNANDKNNFMQKIMDSKYDMNIKHLLYKRYKLYCENNDQSSDEYLKYMEWLDVALNIPVSESIHQIKQMDIQLKLKKLHLFLSSKIYGLNNVKEKIMETICTKILNPNGKNGKVILLVGSPGVGKTAIASVIAEAIEVPFDQISFGSIQDAKILTGHQSTYIGSVPGLFTKILMKSQRLDTLVLFDEIDKITNTQDSNITSVLYHVLDKTQNSRFKDVYIPEIPLDLSQLVVICTANDITKIDPILLDRMEVIMLSGYNLDDKLNISKQFIMPKIIKDLNFMINDINISDDVLRYIILNKTTQQPGMRDVERKLHELYTRILLLKHSDNIEYSFNIENITFPLILTKKHINILC